MGFMLMKKGILEQIDYPWFKPSMTTLKSEEGEIIIQIIIVKILHVSKYKNLEFQYI